jgi:hypothetical protein
VVEEYHLVSDGDFAPCLEHSPHCGFAAHKGSLKIRFPP